MGYVFGQRDDGKNDGHCTTQADPGDVCFIGNGHFAERQQSEEYGERTCKEDHSETNNKRGGSYRQQFARINKETKGEEHEELAHPGKPVEKIQRSSFVGKLGVSDGEAGQVNGQVAVTLKQPGEGEYH